MRAHPCGHRPAHLARVCQRGGVLLTDRTVIVTGGNSGIGAAIAAAAGAAGANVVIDYVARPEATDALDERITDRGGEATGV